MQYNRQQRYCTSAIRSQASAYHEELQEVRKAKRQKAASVEAAAAAVEAAAAAVEEAVDGE